MYLDSGGTIARAVPYNFRRRDRRFVSSIPVKVQRFLRFGPFMTRAITLDVSVRGMSAIVCGAPQKGETVVIALPVRNSTLELLATVRHSSDAKSGFEFYPLSSIAQQGIQEWIKELNRHEESLFPALYEVTGKIGSDS
ncbi:MAG TPA: PilZ domain-containing protein [Terriglobales bacterium]|nr:PilZ domain-containing protein [Terriglobales bacterium]